ALVFIFVGWKARHLFTLSPVVTEAESHWQQANEAIVAREFPQAIAHLERCLESWPLNAEAHFLMARTCRRANQLSDWQQHLARAAVLNWPKDQIDLEMQLQRAQRGDI